MAEPLFFIDTNPDEEETDDLEVKRLPSDKTYSGISSAKAEKARKNKEKDKNLSKLLFGSAAAPQTIGDDQDDKKDPGNEDVGEDEESSGSDSDDEESLDDEDVQEIDDADMDDQNDDDEENVESIDDEQLYDDEDDDKSDNDTDNDENNVDEDDGDEADPGTTDSDSDDSDSDSGRNLQDMLPRDVLAENLNLRRGKKRKAAWRDKADEKVLVKDVAANFKKAPGKHGSKDTSTEKYGKSVERQFKGLVGEPAWAKLANKNDPENQSDSDEEFFRETTDFLDKRKGDKLSDNLLELRKLKDMNNESHREGAVIRSVEFHPTSTVGLTAGLNGTASLFQIDGKNNPKIQTVNFKDFPVKTAKFSVDGTEVIAGSQHHNFCYTYDMIAGKIAKCWMTRRAGEFSTRALEVSPDGQFIAFRGRFGMIHLLTARGKEYVGSMKMNDECQAIKFSKSGAQLFSHGEGGEVYVWDVGTRQCVNKFVDDGCIAGSALAVNSSYLATGSSEGVVNIYSLNKISQPNPTPDKIILNLTTQINNLTFNPTGEILSMSSELKDCAMKLIHLPSKTIFSNFPSSAYNLNKVNAVSFSPGGGYMSIGNNKGAAMLYRLKHYKDY